MKPLVSALPILLLFSAASTSSADPAGDPGPGIVRGAQPAAHRGVYEIALAASGPIANPYFDTDMTVTFTRPDGTRVTVDGCFDGGSTFKARAYCDVVGQWSWTSSAKLAGLNGKSGRFQVVPSALPGKLRRHPRDPHQFAYDNGRWFLHIGDTGYRCLVQTEPKWQEYIDQAARMGATKIRTWVCQSRGGIEALFAADRRQLNLPYWQEIEHRLLYALQRHPQVIFQVILYGEDTAELLRYGQGDPAALLLARYAQARFSALPNVTWCISNDREIVSDGKPIQGRRVPAGVIDQIGRDMAAREPWGTLLTNHQARFSGYAFVDAPWSDIITLEDLDQVDGRLLARYRRAGSDPVVHDEDRYELYRSPKHPRYFFRRLMWASLLSGGQATYGGLRTYEPYDGELQGVQGYYDARQAGKLVGGADDFMHIHKFFAEAGLTLVGMEADDDLVGGDPRRAKCIHDGRTYLIYLANPDGNRPETDNAAAEVPEVTVALPAGKFSVRWFQPTSGSWTDGERVAGSRQRLRAPGGGDWVMLLRATD